MRKRREKREEKRNEFAVRVVIIGNATAGSQG